MPDTIETAQHFIFVTQVFFCYAVVIWDWIVCLPSEWRFVWKTSWTAVKLSYLFCRYWVIFVMPYVLFSFVSDHSLEYCQTHFKVPVALAMWNQAGAEVVLLIRTYAFFNRNQYLLWTLCCSLCGVFAYQLYVIIHQMDLLPFVSKPLAPLAFDSIVTFMTLWKAFHMRRRTGGLSSPLIQTFLREGVFYYLLISVANLVNGIFYLQPRQVISAINIPLSVMFGDVLACRLILDLRERGSVAAQLSIHTSPRLKITGGFIDGDTNSTLFDRSPSWKPPTTPLPTYRPAFVSNSAKTRSIKSVNGKKGSSGGGGHGTVNMTFADNSHDEETKQGYVGDSQRGSVELQCFPPRLPDGDMKMDDDLGLETVGLGISAAPTYHVVDVSSQEDSGEVPLSGIRIDVEKTQM
ncbi:hypothetical protein BD410DRAFT_750322 [Rickenella mellea]|uniref:DUF6533 domain-containing protein n=1 Tax=Rickenella mellea TaxID=50990 RepID=A0A4Y7Q1G6_9AGAM|nr:hypothetical protein BD410DRAFT_750322 [Rickenella mellea]